MFHLARAAFHEFGDQWNGCTIEGGVLGTLRVPSMIAIDINKTYSSRTEIGEGGLPAAYIPPSDLWLRSGPAAHIGSATAKPL